MTLRSHFDRISIASPHSRPMDTVVAMMQVGSVSAWFWQFTFQHTHFQHTHFQHTHEERSDNRMDARGQAVQIEIPRHWCKWRGRYEFV
ncbi:MAG: hypothetical protein HC925_08445 [Coleofasciculaceae cyanobacterium SM2_3_26]|nr:hypothetical protein [Coleofasciculaceae cyanobacterium SM2_3_26]